MGATTEKERSVIQELEEGTAKMNSFISREGVREGVREGGVGVRGNSVSPVRVTREGGVGTAIDENASITKQTIQALRYLFKAGR